MTDHWKDVDLGRLTKYMPRDAHRLLLARIAAARAKDAEDRQQEQQAHAAALAAKDAEITRLRAQIDEDAHLRSVVELYRSDPIAMADALVRMQEALGAAREQLEQRPA